MCNLRCFPLRRVLESGMWMGGREEYKYDLLPEVMEASTASISSYNIQHTPTSNFQAHTNSLPPLKTKTKTQHEAQHPPPRRRGDRRPRRPHRRPIPPRTQRTRGARHMLEPQQLQLFVGWQVRGLLQPLEVQQHAKDRLRVGT